MTGFPVAALLVLLPCALVTLVRFVQATDRRINDQLERDRQSARASEV